MNTESGYPDAVPTPRGIQMTAVVHALYTQLGATIELLSLQAVQSEYLALTQELAAPGDYRVALLGEQPPKAALVNAIFGIHILEPFGALGRTRHICYGEEATLQDGAIRKALPLTPADWDELGHSPASQDIIELRVPGRDKALPDLEVLDLPYRGGSQYDRFEWAEIASCHGAVMVIDAPSQITRHELLRLQEIHRRAGPPILAIIVVGWEDVPSEEHDGVLASVRRAVASEQLNLPVIAVPPSDPGAQALMHVVSKQALLEKPRLGSDWRFRSGLVMVAESVLQALSTAGPDSSTPTVSIIQEGGPGLGDEDTDWSAARLQLRGIALTAVAEISRVVSTGTKAISAHLVEALHRSGDPEAWVRRDLPLELQRDVNNLAQSLDRLISSSVARQLTWSADRAEHLGMPPLSHLVPPASVTPRVPALYLPGSGLERIRFAAQLSGAVVAVLTPILGVLASSPVPDVRPLLDPVFALLGRREMSSFLLIADRSLQHIVRGVTSDIAASVQHDLRRFTNDVLDEMDALRLRKKLLTEDIVRQRADVLGQVRLDRLAHELRVALSSVRG